jgi:uncharacterized protein (TIGR04255 family)
MINEIFPNPTVKNVIFQIKFPNLFYLENKIGDLQLSIMKQFPQSSLILRKNIAFVNVGPEEKPVEIPASDREGVKIWQFKSEKNLKLGITSDSLSISSEYHKTYNNKGGERFRDTIELVLHEFFKIAAIPVLKRIGLRYIDECPIPSKDNETFRSYYNTTFPLDRFDLKDADEMFFRTVIKKTNYYLCYMERLQKIGDDYKLILDFDGFAHDITSEDYLKVTDDLHIIVAEEFEGSIKAPFYEYMRQKKEV